MIFTPVFVVPKALIVYDKETIESSSGVVTTPSLEITSGFDDVQEMVDSYGPSVINSISVVAVTGTMIASSMTSITIDFKSILVPSDNL